MKISFALCLGLSTALVAQQERTSVEKSSEFQPRAHFVTSGDWPLKWISQTFTEEDQAKEIVLQNVGKQTIVGFQLAWAILIPAGVE